MAGPNDAASRGAGPQRPAVSWGAGPQRPAASQGAATQRPAALLSPVLILTKCDLPAAVSSHPRNLCVQKHLNQISMCVLHKDRSLPSSEQYSSVL